MKRVAAVLIASAAFVLPGTVALAAGPAAQPLGAECNITDQVGGPIAASIGDGPLRCGDNRNN